MAKCQAENTGFKQNYFQHTDIEAIDKQHNSKIYAHPWHCTDIYVRCVRESYGL